MRFNRLSKYKIRKILGVFLSDLNATVAAQILRVNRNSVNRYYNLFRKAIFCDSLSLLEKELGVFEADESYFGARRGWLIQDPNESWFEENLFYQMNLGRKQP